MRFLVSVLLSCVALATASSLRGYAEHLYEELQGCSYSATCSSGGVSGVCVSISAGCCKGTTTPGLCPGSSDVKCCTNNPCSTPQGSGTCMQTSLCSSKGGQSISGYCTGPSDIKCCVSGGGSGVYGVDISSAQSTSTMSCFKSNGFSFIVPRGYRSSGSLDSNVCTNLKNAQSAGIATRDVYIFPCPTCSKSAYTQMSELVSHLKSNCNSAWSGRVWLDIEGKQYWSSSTSTNKSWYQQLVDSCKTLGVRCGVYTNKNQWSEIFGSTSYTYGNSLPLWYAHYDNKATFSDFSAFGGWSSPHAKQYAGDVTSCGAGVDKNWAASSF